jgi:hypothetical protein
MLHDVAKRDTTKVSWYDGERAANRHLFELADDSEMQLASYINEGRVLVAWCDDQPVGHLQLIPTSTDEIEIKSGIELRDRVWMDRPLTPAS